MKTRLMGVSYENDEVHITIHGHKDSAWIHEVMDAASDLTHLPDGVIFIWDEREVI
jgi:predicted enzyme involved in methoxymalonyl-ACP biosynthesis